MHSVCDVLSALLCRVVMCGGCSGAEDPLERVFLYDSNSNTITKKASVGLDRPGKVFLRNRVSKRGRRETRLAAAANIRL